MMYVSGLDRGTAERHFRWRALGIPGGLTARPDASDGQAELTAAHRSRPHHHRDQRCRPPRHGALDRSGVRRAARRDRRSRGPAMAASCSARAPRRLSIRCRLRGSLPIRRRPGRAAMRVEPPAPPPAELAAALDALFANSPGIYGILIASPDRVLAERYSAFGAADRATPSWSMTKAITCTLIGRLIHRRLARLGVRSRAGAAVARSALDPPSDHARPSAAHALGPGFSRGRRALAMRRSVSRTARSTRMPPMRSMRRSARSSRPCRARCTATSTPASTCSARSSAIASKAAGCRIIRRSTGCSPTGWA